MVLLVTGKCNTGCFYCPVSAEKKGKDVIYANEMKITDLKDIIEEAEAMEATGTGITGGDPLTNMDRTLEAIRILKGHFGKNHHIHLYTSMMDPEKVLRLQDAGLDEIRFHPSPAVWGNMDTGLLGSIIKGSKIDVGIEVPAIPGYEKELDLLITSAVEAGIKFINLNELEFSESNWDMMDTYNFEINDELSASVRGSEEVALSLMKKHKKAPIHFCSSVFKDGVQLRNRLIRRANHIAKEYDVVTDDGTLLKGVLYADDLSEASALLSKNFKVPDKLMFIDDKRKRLEVAPWVLEEIAEELPYLCYIVEEYSTADRMEVERTPLNRR
jgi:pyruvate formate-lyase activating enzyme-like uncharacterized protein